MFDLTTNDVSNIDVDCTEVLHAVRDVLESLGRGESVNPPKLAFETAEGVVYGMAGYDAASRTVAIKTSYRFGVGKKHELMRYHASLAYFDDRTGDSLGSLDATQVCALRTPAVSALMASTACPQARTALILGSGAQARLAAPFLLTSCLALERVVIYGTHRPGIDAAVAEVEARFPGRTLEVTQDPEAVARDADVVIAASGPRVTRTLSAHHLKKGSVAVLVGYGLSADALHTADYVTATNAAQMHITGADLVDSDGQLPDVDAELADVLLGMKPARRGPNDRVFAYNSGLIVTDIAVGRLLLDRQRRVS